MRKGLLLGLGTLLLHSTLLRAQEQAPAARLAPEAKESLRVQPEVISAPPSSASAQPTKPATLPAPDAKKRLPIATEIITTLPASAPAKAASPAPDLAVTLPASAPIPAHGTVDGCGSCCQPADRTQRFWVSGEYLMWWLKDSPVPVPLATTGPLGPGGTPFGTAPNIPGSLSAAGTQVLLGNESVSTSNHSGFRITLGGWLDDCATWGVEARYFLVADRTARRSVSNDGTALLTVPFLDVGIARGENTLILAAPGNTAFASGSSTLSITNRLQGEELNLVYNLTSSDRLRIDLLGGARFFQFRENLDFRVTSTGVAPNAGIDNSLDSFRATNNFYGAQLGARAEFALGNFFFGVTDKIALGGMHEQVSIDGLTVTNFNPATGGAVRAFPGGVFAQPTNMGDHNRTRLAFANEATATAGYQIGDWGRIFASYNFLYINQVARPGEQIDRAINDTQFQATLPPPGPLVGAARPAFTFRDSNFWAQGISVGLELRY